MIWLGSIFLALLLIGMPIAFVLGVSALGYFVATDQLRFLLVLPQRMLAGMDHFVLLAIPLFVLAEMQPMAGSVRLTLWSRFRVGHQAGRGSCQRRQL
jgi:TRAP-type mannitol/chloroaromatic compound transport system permease large subunit